MNWFWHALWIAFVIIPVTILWFTALIDVVIDPELTIGNRVLWILVIMVLPVLGSLIYIIVRRDRGLRAGRAVSRLSAPSADPSGTVSAQLQSLAGLHSNGALSEEEFAAAKRRVLA